MKQGSGIILLLACIFMFCSCGSNQSGAIKKPSFSRVTNIRFTEVRRAFDTGLSFNKQGFQQVPEWIMYFITDDSAKVYSPAHHRFLHYHVYHDHDSVVNIGWEWFRVKKVSRDSLVMQLLRVNGKAISREMSNVYMTFYSEGYIKNNLHTEAMLLQRPNRRDTLFIRAKAEQANHNPGNIDSSFSARSPVILQSLDASVQADKIKVPDDPLDYKPSDVYMYPEYDITINKAYRDFFYSFKVLVDDKGIIRFAKFMDKPDSPELRQRVLDGIINVYLKRLLKITPGSTLGIPHTSPVTLNVTGRKN